MGLLKKITKPISKFLDKIVPNEIKPALPYLSAFAPFMMGPTVGAGSSQGLMALLRRGALTGGINLASQLAQEGSEGEFDPLSLALASGMGAMTSAEAPGVFRGMQRQVPYKDPMSITGGVITPPAETGIMASISDAIGKGGETAANWLGTQADILRPGADTAPLTMKNALTAGSVPITQGTGDLARISAEQELKRLEDEEDETGIGINDEGRRRAIRAAMEAAGHIEEDILDALAALGLRSGGIVGLRDGGRIGYRERGFVDPNDYPQQEDVSILELQQGEGVNISPMVQEDKQKQLLKAFAEYQAGGGKLSLKEFAVMWMRENAAEGGRVGAEGGGIMNAKRGLVDAPGGYAGLEEIEDMREFRIANQGIEDVADYEGYYKRLKNPQNYDKQGFGGVKEAVKNIEKDEMLEVDAYLALLKNVDAVSEKVGIPSVVLQEHSDWESEKLNMFETREEYNAWLDTNYPKSPIGTYLYHLPAKEKISILEEISIKKASGGRINKEGGGVASVLPKGTEADYRGGGVIPVGSRERADDVPARLSKNEFVMTADAVRAAGEGSVNRGAKKMYNLMHNLEARV
jgi:hypothetical protein